MEQENKEYKLFVGGLAYVATQQDLAQAFEDAGLGEKVLSVEVIMDKFSNRPKGFAFVKMQDEDSMREAIEKMNGVMVKDRAISVNEARPREDRAPRSGGDRGGYGAPRRDGGNGGGFGQRGGSRGGYGDRGGYNR